MNYSQLIDALGGTTEVASICEVTKSAVSQWRTNGIPKPWEKFLAEKYPSVYWKIKYSS